MSRKRLADLTENINTGILRDPGNDRVPLWADGKNIVFDPSGPRPVHGFSRMVFDKPTMLPIRGKIQARIEERKYVFFGDEENLFRYDDDAGTVLEVSKATDAYGGAFWSFGQWGNWILATNDVDPVQVYKESVGNFEDLSHDLGGDLTAVALVTTKAYSLLFGTDSEKRVVRWSHTDDVNTLDPTLSNAAGDLYIRSLASPIIAASPTGRGAFFYGLSTTHILKWTAPPYYFGEDTVSSNVGVVGKNAVVDVRGMTFGIGLNGLWAMQPGQKPEPIGKPHLHNYMYNDLDFDNMHKCVAWYDQQQDLVIFSYPSREDDTEEPSRSIALTLQTGGWSPLDFAPTAAAYSPALQYTSVGDSLGGIYWHGVPGAGGGLPFDTQAFISLADSMTFYNYYGISGYGKFLYGGPL